MTFVYSVLRSGSNGARRTRISVSLIAAFCLALWAQTALANVIEGKPAPDFRATQFDGTKVTLSSFKGDVLVINIWATWCAPCRKELPLLDAYYRLNEKHGMRVLAVTTEDSLPPTQLKKLQNAIGIPLARHFRGPYQPVDGAVPSNFVIDRKGVVRFAKAGAFDLDELNAVLIPLLREPRPAE